MALLIDDQFNDGSAGNAFVPRNNVSYQGVQPLYSAGGYNGTVGLSIDGSVAAASLVEATTASSITKYADVFLYIPGTATAANSLLTLRGSAGDVLRVGISGSGKMNMQNGAGTSLGTSNTLIPIGAWFRLALAAAGSNASATLYADPTSDTPTATLSGTITSTAMTLTRVGNITGAAFTSSTVGIDWLQVSNDAAPTARSVTPATSGTTVAYHRVNGNWLPVRGYRRINGVWQDVNL